MSEGKYVIQERFNSWDPWRLLPGTYPAAQTAMEVIQSKAYPHYCRIAEAYTVTRYKAIRNI